MEPGIDECIEVVREAGYAVVDKSVLQEVYDLLGQVYNKAEDLQLSNLGNYDVWYEASEIKNLAVSARLVLAETGETHD